MDQLLLALIAAASAIVAAYLTYRSGKHQAVTTVKLLSDQLESSKQKIREEQTKSQALEISLAKVQKDNNKLNETALKYEKVREKLKESKIVITHSQPVILVGNRFVGKTSLLMQWHAPWDNSLLGATSNYYIANVPIHDYIQQDATSHFADPELFVPAHIHLSLKVYDFPGELSRQKYIKQLVVQETKQFIQDCKKNLGIVIICFFDAGEAENLGKDTLEYYNGELFAELRSLVSMAKVRIDKLVLVFNKYDKLKEKYPDIINDDILLKKCIEGFSSIYNPLKGICNPEKVCEVFTMLSREDWLTKNRGAPIVLGEASRAFVEAFVGKEKASDIIKSSATNYSSAKFM